MRLWILRIVWLALPLSAGAATAAVLDDLDRAPAVAAAVLLWLAWGAGLVALLAPRPIGLTVIRVVAPTFVVLAILIAIVGDASTIAAWGAVLATLVAAVLVADPAFAIVAVNGLAYGDEQRHPLRAPPGLYLAPIPLARALVAVGIAAGPLLLADGEILWGLAALVVGWPVAALAGRALHPLARRWVVLVPAGVVIVDPMTIVDPVLFVRQHVRALRAVDPGAPIPAGALDLRLGASWGSLMFDLDGGADLVRSTGRGRTAETLQPDAILVAVAARDALLTAAAQRRVRVEFV